MTARADGRDPVTVRALERDSEGRVVEEEIATHRNRWIVERSDFLAERAAAAQTFRDARPLTPRRRQGASGAPGLVPAAPGREASAPSATSRIRGSRALCRARAGADCRSDRARRAARARAPARAPRATRGGGQGSRARANADSLSPARSITVSPQSRKSRPAESPPTIA